MLGELGLIQWLAAATAVFAGGLITGVSGFGFALVTAPVLLWIVDPVTMVTTNLVLSVLTRLPIVVHDRSHLDQAQTTWLAVGGTFGLPLGIVLIGMLDGDSAKVIVNMFVIVFGAPFLLAPQRIPTLAAPGRTVTSLVGLVSGILTTSSSLSGPPVVLWLTSQRLVRHAFRVTTSLVGIILNVIGLALLVSVGKTAIGSLGIPLVLFPGAALGGYIGHRVLQRISDGTLVRVAAAVVVSAGAIGIIASLLS